MKSFVWSAEKNEILKQERGVSFDDVLSCIETGKVLDVIEQPNQGKYPEQMIYIIELNEYIYLVPFIEKEEEIFLKTIIPSRKAKKLYKGQKDG